MGYDNIDKMIPNGISAFKTNHDKKVRATVKFKGNLLSSTGNSVDFNYYI